MIIFILIYSLAFFWKCQAIDTTAKPYILTNAYVHRHDTGGYYCPGLDAYRHSGNPDDFRCSHHLVWLDVTNRPPVGSIICAGSGNQYYHAELNEHVTERMKLIMEGPVTERICWIISFDKGVVKCPCLDRLWAYLGAWIFPDHEKIDQTLAQHKLNESVTEHLIRLGLRKLITEQTKKFNLNVVRKLASIEKPTKVAVPVSTKMQANQKGIRPVPVVKHTISRPVPVKKPTVITKTTTQSVAPVKQTLTAPLVKETKPAASVIQTQPTSSVKPTSTQLRSVTPAKPIVVQPQTVARSRPVPVRPVTPVATPAKPAATPTVKPTTTPKNEPLKVPIKQQAPPVPTKTESRSAKQNMQSRQPVVSSTMVSEKFGTVSSTNARQAVKPIVVTNIAAKAPIPNTKEKQKTTLKKTLPSTRVFRLEDLADDEESTVAEELKDKQKVAKNKNWNERQLAATTT